MLGMHFCGVGAYLPVYKNSSTQTLAYLSHAVITDVYEIFTDAGSAISTVL
jgi:hypothetical protein